MSRLCKNKEAHKAHSYTYFMVMWECAGVARSELMRECIAIIQDVSGDIENEIHRAVEKHGAYRTPMNPEVSAKDAYIILAEEVGEVARALTYDEGNIYAYEEELVQVAAMAILSIVGSRLRRKNP